MTILHHPTDETLARYAARTLSAGPALVLATHVAGCGICRAQVGHFEALGGALLEDFAAAPMAEEVLERTLAMVDRPYPVAARRRRQPLRPAILPIGELPLPLRDYDIGRWRWLAPGIRWSRVEIPEDRTANVMLLWSEREKSIPAHGHTGAEFTQILSGALSDGPDTYRAGDLSEVDSDVDHQPHVESSGCVCLAALEGHIRPHSFLGRLLRPFMSV